jgi:hypothetical protein
MVALFMSYVSGAVADNDKKPITFEMTITQFVGKRGPEPQFNFRIVNVSDAPVRVLDIAKRPDFHDAYLGIDISRRGPGDELEMMISDPNIPDENSFTELAPGEALEYALPLSRTVYVSLSPGNYWARGTYRPEPLGEQGLGNYVSETVEFTIPE